jgi:hypothetical protein
MGKKYTKLNRQQDGLVSIIVTILIMLLLTLITLAMSQNARQEQRQALDRQLSDQAFYNAETGINDVVNYLYKNPDSAALEYKADCNMPFLASNANVIGNPNNRNQYTCLLYNKAPFTLEFDNVGIAEGRVIPIEPVKDTGVADNINSFIITWDDANGTNTSSGCNFTSGATSLPPQLPGSCTIGGVKIDLISPTVITSDPTSPRDQLIQRMFNAYLLPNASSGGNLSILAGGYPETQGIISQANCTGAPGERKCKMKISDIGATKLVLHIRALYKSVDITIKDGLNSAGQPVRFSNAQIMVDATGKASDVLRRVQVRVPAKPQFDTPEFGVQSKESICKLVEVDADSAQSIDTTNCPIPTP